MLVVCGAGISSRLLALCEGWCLRLLVLVGLVILDFGLRCCWVVWCLPITLYLWFRFDFTIGAITNMDCCGCMIVVLVGRFCWRWFSGWWIWAFVFLLVNLSAGCSGLVIWGFGVFSACDFGLVFGV